MKADQETRKAVITIMNRFQKAVASRDIERSLEIFSDDPDVFLTGSEAGETAKGPVELKAFFKRVFARPFAYIFEWDEFSVSRSGSVAWARVDALVYTKGDRQVSKKPYSITVILNEVNGVWRIIHYHGSEPATHWSKTDRSQD